MAGVYASFQLVQLVIQYKGECEGEGNGKLGALSVTLLLPELIPVVILQSLDHIVLRLLGGEVFGDERFQPFRLEADFLPLVGLLLTHNGENHVGVEPAVLGKFFHLQGLRQGRGGLFGTDGIQQAVLFLLGQVG